MTEPKCLFKWPSPLAETCVATAAHSNQGTSAATVGNRGHSASHLVKAPAGRPGHNRGIDFSLLLSNSSNQESSSSLSFSPLLVPFALKRTLEALETKLRRKGLGWNRIQQLNLKVQYWKFTLHVTAKTGSLLYHCPQPATHRLWRNFHIQWKTPSILNEKPLSL